MRARRILGEVDVILYDALVHPALLELAQPEAELVFVGKRAGQPSARQKRINERLVEEAKAGRSVARLKGGDPYLFGRGSEEAAYLVEHGVSFEVVPGVPSPLAATAYAGISLTHRDLASSVAYLTATESPLKDRSSHDWAKLATATQSLVIFMGRRRLPHLMEMLIEHGRPPETPAAVIQSASLATQKTIVGTVADIAEKAAAANLRTPAITIVGEVINLRHSLRWFDLKPLFGKRVLITRAKHQAGDLASLLREAGAESIRAATIRFAPPSDMTRLERAVGEVEGYDYSVFTSPNGVDNFFTALQAQGKDARAVQCQVVAIGPKTAEKLRTYGVRADIIPEQMRGEGAANALLAHYESNAARPAASDVRVLLARAEVARPVLPDTLREAGLIVDDVASYQTLPPDTREAARIRKLFADGEVDIVTATSSSTIRNLVHVLGEEYLPALKECLIASIGPVTSETVRRLGLEVSVQAATATVESLVQDLKAHYD